MVNAGCCKQFFISEFPKKAGNIVGRRWGRLVLVLVLVPFLLLYYDEYYFYYCLVSRSLGAGTLVGNHGSKNVFQKSGGMVIARSFE